MALLKGKKSFLLPARKGANVYASALVVNTYMSISLKLREVQVLQEERTDVEAVSFNLGSCPAEGCDSYWLSWERCSVFFLSPVGGISMRPVGRLLTVGGIPVLALLVFWEDCYGGYFMVSVKDKTLKMSFSGSNNSSTGFCSSLHLWREFCSCHWYYTLWDFKWEILVDGGIGSVYSSWLASQLTCMKERFPMASTLASPLCPGRAHELVNFWEEVKILCTCWWTSISACAFGE